LERKIVCPEAQIWGRRGEICASGAPNDFSRSSETPNTPTHYSEEPKYFLSNMVAGSEGITLEWLLWVAFSRWPIERCFEVGKRGLGMDHFEVRSWQAIHRHFYISQLSQLFCARVHHELRKKTPESYYLTVEQVHDATCAWLGAQALPYSARKIIYQDKASEASEIGYQNQSIEILCTV